MSFDFQGLGVLLAGISFGLIGVIMTGSMLFPEWGERAKRQYLPNVIIGLVILGVSSLILAFFGG